MCPAHVAKSHFTDIAVSGRFPYSYAYRATPVKENDLGVALVSGFSPNIAKMVMSGQTDPYDCLLEAINAERYQQVDDALRPIISA